PDAATEFLFCSIHQENLLRGAIKCMSMQMPSRPPFARSMAKLQSEFLKATSLFPVVGRAVVAGLRPTRGIRLHPTYMMRVKPRAFLPRHCSRLWDAEIQPRWPISGRAKRCSTWAPEVASTFSYPRSELGLLERLTAST